jgi:hypothetical protein
VDSERLTQRRIFETWWPLAGSWLLMGLELPAVSAVMARLPAPTVSLAAYGGVVFPLSLIIEAPIIMLLSASTALSKDWRSYVLLRRFMIGSAAALTALHALVAFTPLYDLVVARLLGAPVEIREPARLGMQIMLPWTASIAYRRFQQGVLIRFGRSRAVGVGTAVRLGTNLAVLLAGYAIGTLPGIAVGTSAVAAGVMSEALYIGLRVHPVLRDSLRPAPPAPALTRRDFARFYTPLAMTSILTLASAPITSAGLGRMPRALDSLAVWPVLNGLVFTFRSLGFAVNEVVIALLDRPHAIPELRRFARNLAGAMSLALLVTAATPLARLWFSGVSALPGGLTDLACIALWLSFLIPGLNVLQSWYQGIIVHSRKTRRVTEAVALYLVVSGALLVAGIVSGSVTGLYVALVAMVVGMLAQVLWLWRGARREMRAA